MFNIALLKLELELWLELVDGANRRHVVTEVQIIHLGSVILISVHCSV